LAAQAASRQSYNQYGAVRAVNQNYSAFIDRKHTQPSSQNKTAEQSTRKSNKMVGIEDTTQKIDFKGMLNNKPQKAQISTTLNKAYTQDRLPTKEPSLLKTNNIRNH